MNLAPHHISTLQSLFAKHPPIKEALLFGSRALGTHKESSDIDIALKGDISPTLIAHLKEELEDSTLPYFCDIISYEKAPKKLKESIDSHALPLYTKEVQWQEVRLGEVVEIVNGYAFKSKDFLNTRIDNALPVIKIKNVANGDVNLDDIQYHLYDPKLNRYVIQKSDILISLTGNHPHANTQVVGKVSRYKLKEKALLNQRVANIYPKAIVDKDFLYYFLKLDSTHKELASKSSGSGNQANISKSDIESLTIPLPPLERQREIAEILSSFDDKIDFLHRQNKTLESLAQTLFHHYFIEETQDEKMGVFADEFLITMGSSPIGTSYNTHLGTPLFQGSADFNFRYPNNRIYTTKPTKIANPKDTLLSVRAPVGVINMAKEKCCIGRGLASIRHLGKNNLSSYTYYKTMSSLSKIQTYDDSGTVFGSIKHKELNNIETKILSERQAQKLEKILNVYDDKIEYNTNMIALYEKIKIKYLKVVFGVN